MDKKEQARQDREERALAEHARLAELFKTDRMAFERERKEAIAGIIGQCDDLQRRDQLNDLQDKIDCVMSGAKSPHNRLVLMQMLFWDQVHNVFMPALQMCQQIKPCWDCEKDKANKMHLRLCKKT